MSDTELLPKPKPEPVRRLEVFTGTGRRRAWSAEQKARIVAESYAAARRYRRLPAGTRLRRSNCSAGAGKRGAGQKTAPARAGGICAGDRGCSFGRCADAPMAPARPGGAPMIEIVLGAATVRIRPGIDAATLTTVLRAMRAAT